MLDRNVYDIMSVLYNAGHSVYLVGGAVRNMMLGLKAKDYDIATSALPTEVQLLFPEHRDTGIDYGTVTVKHNNKEYEITTFRKETYRDDRHPSVEFTDNIYEDLSRRDFTINAMAVSIDDELIDPYNGQEDLKSRVIRTVGNTKDRMQEDPLRELRAIRFATVLGFALHKDLLEYLRENTNVDTLSKERINAEMVRIFSSQNVVYGMHLLHECKMWEVFFPFLTDTFVNHPYHYQSVYAHTLNVVRLMAQHGDLNGTVAALLHDAGKKDTHTTDEYGVDHYMKHASRSAEIAKEWLNQYGFSNDQTKTIVLMVKHHDFSLNLTPKKITSKLLTIFKDDWNMALTMLNLRRADIQAQSTRYSSRLSVVEQCKEVLLKQLTEPSCLTLKSLAVNGDDLTAIGVPQSKVMKEILNKLLDKVVMNKIENDKETLLKEALSLITVGG